MLFGLTEQPAKMIGMCAHGAHEMLHCIYVFICARSGPPKVAAHAAAERDDPLHYAAGPYESLRKIFGRDARGVFSAPVGNGAHMTQ